MDRQAIETLINNIENSTLNDAEEIFNDIMDLKAGETISARREEIAAGVFNTDDYLNYSPSRFLSYTKAIFEKEIYEKMKDYDLCFVHNQSIKDDKLALLFMSLGSQNLMLLDSRETSEKSILKIELLKDEFHINNLWFVLNKAGYNPNVFVEIKKFIERYLKNK